MTLDEWLSKIYAADLQGHFQSQMDFFHGALSRDKELLTAAQLKLIELNKLVEARGETACAYSTKYRDYLKEALS